ncbi:hypothetical protein [Streptomyces altiplanensis]
MRPALLLAGTVLAAAVSGLGAGPAYAGNDAPEHTLEVYPASAGPGTTITVNTTACGSGSGGTGDANALEAGDFPLRPATHKEVVTGEFEIPADALPGSYDIAVACDNGNTAQGSLTVTAGSTPAPVHPTHPAHPPAHRPAHPEGHVKTGVGGSAGSDTTQIAAGAAVLAATAVGGTWLLRRRASGTRDS